jgi:hypothetical protein
MAPGNAAADLRRLFERYKSRPFPRVGRALNPCDEVDVDLAEEDSYLAGLVETFLRSGRIDVKEIVLDQTLDERVERASTDLGTDGEALRTLKDYRDEMWHLARALGGASGVPVRPRHSTWP